MLTKRELEDGIDDDGTSEPYQGVETRYARCQAITSFDLGDDGAVVVIADYQDCYIETRIQYDTLRSLGWVRQAKAT